MPMAWSSVTGRGAPGFTRGPRTRAMAWLGASRRRSRKRWKVRMADSAWLSERGASGLSPWRRWASQARTSPALTSASVATVIASPRCCSMKAMYRRAAKP